MLLLHHRLTPNHFRSLQGIRTGPNFTKKLSPKKNFLVYLIRRNKSLKLVNNKIIIIIIIMSAIVGINFIKTATM